MIFKKLVLLVFLFVSAGLAHSSVNGWTSIGPYGGEINQIIFDPGDSSILYAATSSGVFRSIDGGSSWSLVLPGSNFSIATTSNGSHVVAASLSGLQVSVDAGVSWSDYEISEEQGASGISHLAVSGQAILLKTYGGDLFYSDDIIHEGAQLPEFNLLTGISVITSLFIDPADPSHLFIGSSGGLYSSSDAGQSWAVIALSSSTDLFENFSADPNSSSTFYAATYDGGILKSTDSGNSWATTSSQPFMKSVAVDPKNSNIVYAGGVSRIYRSSNAGLNFSLVNTIGADTIAVHPSSVKVFFGNTANLYSSSDSGITIQASSTGLNATAPELLKIQPVTGRLIVGGISGHGLYMSDDDGNLIETSTSLSLTPVTDIAFNSQDSDILFAAGIDSSRSVSKTTDAGVTWVNQSSGLSDRASLAIAISATNPDFLVYGSSGSSTQNLALSSNAAINWTDSSDALTQGTDIQDILIDPVDEGIIYAATASRGVIKSIDKGNSWVKINTGLPTTAFINLTTVTSIANIQMNPLNGELFASYESDTIFRSTDDGSSWTALEFEAQDESGTAIRLSGKIAFHPTEADTFYIGEYKTNNSGQTFCHLRSDLPSDTKSIQSVIDPNNPNRLFLSTHNGIYEIEFSSVEPVANAGEDASIGTYLYDIPLDGSDSLDSNGCITEYEWALISGPDAKTLPENEMVTSFEADEDGTYVFELTVTDDNGDTASDRVTITVSNISDSASSSSGGGSLNPFFILFMLTLIGVIQKLRRRNTMGMPEVMG